MIWISEFTTSDRLRIAADSVGIRYACGSLLMSTLAAASYLGTTVA